MSILFTVVLLAPAAATDVEAFIESRRGPDNGAGVVIYSGRHDLDDDGAADTFVIYTYGHGPNRGDRVWGQYVVAFLSTPGGTQEPTNVLFLPDHELMTLRRHAVEYGDGRAVVSGEKRLPDDAMCCPTGEARVTFKIVGGELVAES